MAVMLTRQALLSFAKEARVISVTSSSRNQQGHRTDRDCHGYHTESPIRPKNLDFASKDILGITSTKSIMAQIPSRFEACSNIISSQLESSLRVLFGKQNVSLIEENAVITCGKLAARLECRDIIAIGQTPRFDEHLDIKETIISNIEDLWKTASLHSSGIRIIFIEMDSSSSSIHDLRAVCEVARTTGSYVFCSDPHGTILMRHVIGESPNLLATLTTPTYLHSSLQLISPERPVFTFAEESGFYKRSDWHQPAYLTSLLQRLRALPLVSEGGLTALGHLTQVNQRLSDLGLTTEICGYELMVTVEKPLLVDDVMQRLKRCHVDVKTTCRQKQDYLCVMISAHHTQGSINQLIWAITRSFKIASTNDEIFPNSPPTSANTLQTQRASYSHTGKSKHGSRRKKLGDFNMATSSNWITNVMNRDVSVRVSTRTSPEAEDWSLLESVYSWDTYHETKSLVLGDASETGLM